MKTKAIFFIISFLVSISTINLFAAEIETNNYSWDLGVIDQLLSTVQPGQNLVRVGDMWIQVSYLQAWRNKLAGGPQANLAFNGGFPAWTGGNVSYSFSNNVSAVKQKAFLDGMAEWAMFANLHFILWSNEANYVLIYEQTGAEGGASSAVGMVGGQQTINIAPDSWNRPTICHELGHVLGLVHEHQRSDRNSYVIIRTNNIAPGDEGNFVLLSNSQNETPYDFLSVMHYSRNLQSTNPDVDTIDPLPAYTNYLNTMGNLSDPVLSASDRAGMAAVYGAGPAITSIVTNTLDSGPGSLRAALYYAFDHPGTTITFNIPVTDPGYSNGVFNIQPSFAEPGLWYNTTLDGSTEPTRNPNGPAILLSGVLAWPLDTFPDGIRFRGTNCVARSFVVNNFPECGVLFDGTNAFNNTCSGCYLGLDQTGTNIVPNGICPAQFSDGAWSNILGGVTAAARNVIGGSIFQGVMIRDVGTHSNLVEGNYIGLTPSGMVAVGNGTCGVNIFSNAAWNVIGGTVPGAGNVIGGNGAQGVLVQTYCNTNVIEGNFIGLNAAGTAAVPNGVGGTGYAGIEITTNSVDNVVGGLTAGARNIISGNTLQGVLISSAGTTGNIVEGNYIGLNPAGTAAIGNGTVGANISAGAAGNYIGGTVAGAGNIISGNGAEGVLIQDFGTSDNFVWGNYVGLNAAGTAAVPNTTEGVNIAGGPSGNYVGGTALGAGNVISGNGLQGVLIQYPGTTGNFVQGNYIGLNPAGNTAISNTWSGVEISGGPTGNLIGGYGSARNFISGNGQYGTYVDFANGNMIQGNTIGLNATNGTMIPNGLITEFADTGFYEASSNVMGGVFPGAANIIAGNVANVGVQVDWYATNNTIRGNSIFGNAGGAFGIYEGGNNDLNPPTLTSAVVGTNTVVFGNYAGTVGQTYIVDFYSDATPTYSAECMTYLGSITVAGTGGTANFTANLGAHLPLGRAVTATVTDPFGNTSPSSSGVAATMTSTPNDGIPDAWRQQYFPGSGTTTNSQSDAFADADQTGLDNYQKFLAGLNPTNTASVFKLVALNPTTSTNAVSLNTSSGTVYRILSSSDLYTGYWAILADQIIGTGTNMLFYDPQTMGMVKRFYRAEVVW